MFFMVSSFISKVSSDSSLSAPIRLNLFSCNFISSLIFMTPPAIRLQSMWISSEVTKGSGSK